MKKYLSIILLLLTTVVGCKNGSEGKDISSNALLKQTETGVYFATSSSYFKYDASTCQLSFSADMKSFRIQTDEQDKYINCVLSAIPTNVGSVVTMELDAAGVIGLVSANYELEALRIQDSDEWTEIAGDGKTIQKIWLWDSNANIGFIVLI